MSGMDELERAMPDPDRRDAALERLAAVVKHAEDIWPSHFKNPGVSGLDDKDRRILQALSSGLTRDEAAEVLGYTLESIKERLKKEKRLLRAKNTVQVVANALRVGFIT